LLEANAHYKKCNFSVDFISALGLEVRSHFFFEVALEKENFGNRLKS
jgi:hypothetical protein